MELSVTRGRLVAVGGGEDRDDRRTILKEFVRLAEAPKTSIVVMTMATDAVERTSRLPMKSPGGIINRQGPSAIQS
jgi:cyanophycinase-like exopeptidase